MSATSIPANQIVAVTPGVISAAGSNLTMRGLLLTTASTRVPNGSVFSFPNAAAVASFFGLSSAEYAFAIVYFNGFNNSNVKPASILIATYNQANAPAYLRGAQVTATPTALNAQNGNTLSITVNGTVYTATLVISGQTTYSGVASAIQASFTTPPFTVTYDSVSGAFVFTSTVSGAASTITFPTGTAASALGLTQAVGAVVSQGVNLQTPAAIMASVTSVTQSFATVSTVTDPDNYGGTQVNKMAFAAWANGQNNKYLYIGWEYLAAAANTGDTTTFGPQVVAANDTGVACLYAPTLLQSAAAFLMGAIASINFTQLNGRATMAFRGQTGLVPDVTNGTAAQNLIANGYNFYGQYATQANQFQWLYPGAVSGPFKWIDSYINQIWLNDGLQVAILSLLQAVGSIPYNAPGYGLVRAACMDPILAALNFGAIRAGVPLSASQAAQVNNAAGIVIDQTLSTAGWYLQINPTAAPQRATRSSPPCTLWYCDGQSIQAVNLASLEIQ